MLDPGILIFFTGTSLLLALAPGPDNIFVLTQSAIQGPLVGIVITLGLCTGLIVHTMAVAFGLAVVFQVSSLAFILLKCLGAAYLLYLAYSAFQAGALLDAVAIGRENLWRFYRRGILMNVSNPKVSIFFLAFLPQFSDPAKGNLPLQLILLGFLFMLSALIVFALISLLAGLIAKQFRRSARIQQGLNIGTGIIFVGLALKLLLWTD